MTIVAAIVFILSGGLLFSERFRENRSLLLFAGLFALVAGIFTIAGIMSAIEPPDRPAAVESQKQDTVDEGATDQNVFLGSWRSVGMTATFEDGRETRETPNLTLSILMNGSAHLIGAGQSHEGRWTTSGERLLVEFHPSDEYDVNYMIFEGRIRDETLTLVATGGNPVARIEFHRY